MWGLEQRWLSFVLLARGLTSGPPRWKCTAVQESVPSKCLGMSSSKWCLGLIHEFYVCCKHLLMLSAQKKTPEITQSNKDHNQFVASKSPSPRPPNLSLAGKRTKKQVKATAQGFFIIFYCHLAWRCHVPPTNHMFSNQCTQPQPASNCLLHKLCNTSLVLPHISFHWMQLPKRKSTGQHYNFHLFLVQL